MVGRRFRPSFSNGRAKDKKDENNPFRPKPAAFRFQDVSHRAMEDERRKKLKNKLIDAVKGDELEHHRKSEDEVCPSTRISPLAIHGHHHGHAANQSSSSVLSRTRR